MNYILLLQWPGSEISDYDHLISMEDRLQTGLGEGHEVNGHDFGCDEMNIFLDTPDPRAALDEVRALLKDDPRWPEVRVGYRRAADDGYIPLWPADLGSVSVK